MPGAAPPPPPHPGGMPPSSRPPVVPPPPGAMPPMPPGAPAFGHQLPSGGSNGMATASLVLGIVGIPLCFLFLPSILAVIFGIIGLSQIKSNPGQSGRGKAIAGLFLGGISLVFIIGLVVFIGTWDFDFETQTILF